MAHASPANGASLPEQTPLTPAKPKLHGRAFYESIGSPKFVLAPMVDQSEFAWRLLSRSFIPAERQNDLVAYTPMFHSRMFHEQPKYRDACFQPLRHALPSPPDENHTQQFTLADANLDGNPAVDRPLFVQFCSNKPEDLLAAAKHVAPFCDAVDLNLGCPQGIAKKGHYGAFLQEDWDLIHTMIKKLHEELSIPVTAKMRVLETREKTLEYAKTILSAGASILTVHGRQRHQKGHETGLADWSAIRYLRDNLPPETVLFANGNILQHEDIAKCLEATGADGVMSAEGNLHDPTVFAGPPPEGQEGREYWRGRDGKGGYRMDAVLRRYIDIIYKYVLKQDPPPRNPLFLPSDPPPPPTADSASETAQDDAGQPPTKKQKRQNNKDNNEKRKVEKVIDPNLGAMQGHLFRLLRPLVSKHTHIRDALARCRTGDIAAFENVLQMVEAAVRQGLIEYESNPGAFEQATTTSTAKKEGEHKKDGQDGEQANEKASDEADTDPYSSSLAAVNRCKRPWFICQPYVRPLPKEAIAKGSLTLSKKEKARLQKEQEEKAEKKLEQDEKVMREAGVRPEGHVERVEVDGEGKTEGAEVPKEGMVCG